VSSLHQSNDMAPIIPRCLQGFYLNVMQHDRLSSLLTSSILYETPSCIVTDLDASIVLLCTPKVLQKSPFYYRVVFSRSRTSSGSLIGSLLRCDGCSNCDSCDTCSGCISCISCSGCVSGVSQFFCCEWLTKV